MKLFWLSIQECLACISRIMIIFFVIKRRVWCADHKWIKNRDAL